MKTLVLHIGRQKTGTSSIQTVLDRQRDWLSRHDIWYPDTGRGTKRAHHAFAHSLNPRQSDEATFIKTYRQFQNEMQERPESMVILSSEGLQNILEMDRIQALSTDYRLIVVCYLRECLAWKQSSWAQRVHAQPFISGFAEFALSRPLDYAVFCKRWARVADKMCLALFDRDYLHNGNVVDDFFKRIGCDLSSSEYAEISDTQMNPSIGGNLLYFKLLMNFAGMAQPSFSGNYNLLSELACSEARWRGRFRVAANDAKQIRKFDKASNNFLRCRFGDCPIQDTTTLPPVPDTEFLVQDFEMFLSKPALAESFSHLGLFTRKA